MSSCYCSNCNGTIGCSSHDGDFIGECCKPLSVIPDFEISYNDGFVFTYS